MTGRLRLLAWPLVALTLLLVACGEDAQEALEAPTAPTSQIAFVSDRDSYRRIYVMDPNGANQRPLTGPRYGDDSSPAWSPDGSQIAFSSDRSGELEIFVMDADGGNQRNITRNRLGSDTQPAWSPDGTQVVYVFGPYSGIEHIRVMDTDGGNPRKLSVPKVAWPRGPQWTPDGRRIVLYSRRNDSEDPAPSMVIVDADGQNAEVLVEGPGSDGRPVWSPDGARVAWSSADWGAQITVMDIDGSNRREVTKVDTGAAVDPTWSPDGRSLAYAAIDHSLQIAHAVSTSTGADIYVVDLGDLRVRRLTNSRDFDGMPAWSP